MRKINGLLTLACWAALLSCQERTSSQESTPAAGARPDTAAPASSAQQKDSTAVAGSPADPAVVAMVRARLKQLYKNDLAKGLIPEEGRKFLLAQHDLNADGRPEVFVGLTGPYFCGSGGCSFLLLSPAGELLTSFSVSRYPVVVASERTNGWQNLLIESSSHYHVMKFNGKKYPANPSVQPVLGTAPAATLPRVLDDTAVPASAWISF